METRRSFLKKSALMSAAMASLAPESVLAARSYPPMKTTEPKKALVFWYSQTGHTARIGRIISRAWEKRGIAVTAGEYREIDRSALGSFDLIAAGTPVFYLDVPENYRKWLLSLPSLTGTAAASFATFGGKGDNQHNTAAAVLSLLCEKGAVPAGMSLFGNMSTYAPTWSLGNEARTLRFRHLPDEGTYRAARQFAASILAAVGAGKAAPIKARVTLNELFKRFPQVGTTKLFIGKHTVDRDRCILCRKCEKACPVAAIDPGAGRVDKKRCILCMGCVNNCPVEAVVMTMFGKKIYGFREFLRRKKITIREPEELEA